MTVTTQTNKTIALGDGINTVFTFDFIGVSAASINVIYTDAAGNETLLSPSLYTLALTAAVSGALWGIGGTVTYPLVGSPIAAGTTLTIYRDLTLTQLVSLQNQASYGQYASSAERANDMLEMQLQQVAEQIGRQFAAPITDEDPPDPLPAAALRANKAFVFDADGQPTAGVIPSSGTISAPMVPVVGAASLAAARTAFGLRGLAQFDIGAGLQDDTANGVRVNSAVSQVATNQAIAAASHRVRFMATGALTFTLARANTLWSGFEFWVYSLSDNITFAINANDKFGGGSTGVSFVIPAGSVARITTDAASSGTWYAEVVLPAWPNSPQVQVVNATIGAPAFAGNAMTVALKTALGNDPSPTDPVFVLVRSTTATLGTYSVLPIVAALSIVASSGSTLGSSNGVGFRLRLGVFNDAGTPRLGLVNSASANLIYPLVNGALQSSTAEGGAGAADSAGVIYTGTAVTAKPFVVIGSLDFSNGQAAAGTWLTAPDVIELVSLGSKMPGETVQRQRSQTGAVLTGILTVIPLDNTTPQNTEGVQLMTLAITPTAKVNRLKVTVAALLSCAAVTSPTLALFQDSTAGALAVMAGRIAAAADAAIVVIELSHQMIAATLSATTFKARAGPNTAVELNFNGLVGTGAIFNGLCVSYIEIEEISA